MSPKSDLLVKLTKLAEEWCEMVGAEIVRDVRERDGLHLSFFTEQWFATGLLFILDNAPPNPGRHEQDFAVPSLSKMLNSNMEYMYQAMVLYNRPYGTALAIWPKR